MSGNERRDFRKRPLHDGKEMKTRGNFLVVPGNGLCGCAHPRTDSRAVCGWCVVMGMLRNMRSIGPVHAPHDEEEHQNESNGETFSICHVIYRLETSKTLNEKKAYAREIRKILSSKWLSSVSCRRLSLDGSLRS